MYFPELSLTSFLDSHIPSTAKRSCVIALPSLWRTMNAAYFRIRNTKFSPGLLATVRHPITGTQRDQNKIAITCSKQAQNALRRNFRRIIHELYILIITIIIIKSFVGSSRIVLRSFVARGGFLLRVHSLRPGNFTCSYPPWDPD